MSSAGSSSRIHHEFQFDPAFSDVSTPIAAVLEARRGVCQDFAHLALACLRSRRPGRSLRQRVHRDGAAAGPAQADGHRRVARVVQCVVTDDRLDRPRSDQRSGAAAASHHRRVGPRLLRRHPGPRRRHRPEGQSEPARRRRRDRARLTATGVVDGSVRFPLASAAAGPGRLSGCRSSTLEPTLQDDQCYRAVQSRDSRFDGWFVVAVHTTGIYCRPSCPAITPKRQNVSFFPAAAGRAAARVPRLQALPARRVAGLARVERARRRRRPGDAPDRRRRHRSRRGRRACRAGSATANATSTG